MPRKAKPAKDHAPSPTRPIAADRTLAEVLRDGNVADPELPDDKSGDPAQGTINDKIRLLIRLSKEQGYLTFQDINDALPETVDNPEDIENVISILQNLEIDILDPEDVDTYKARQEEI